jgi:hypothetical protein
MRGYPFIYSGGGGAPRQRSVWPWSCNHWIHYHRTAFNPRARVIWHVLNVWGRRWTARASMGRLANLPMAVGPHHFLLEGVPTCHGVCLQLWSRWMLRCGPMNPCDFVFHPWEKTQVWSKGGEWLWGTSHGLCPLARPGGFISRSGDLHMEVPQAHFLQFCHNLHT